MTAAHNEQERIETTIASILSQTKLPSRWVIVSDRSTDRTDEIVEAYARQCSFIRFVRIERSPGRDFASKVTALHQGASLLQDVNFDFIGNIDADITVEPTYFSALIDRFDRNPRLGIVAGYIHEKTRGEYRSRRSNRLDSVPHAAQLVRRECYEQIGGYAVLRYGGEDWHAQTCARMNGWDAEAVPELKVFHHRHTGGAGNLLRDRFRLGRLDYSFGSSPLFELMKCGRRLPERPIVIGAIARLAGFSWSYVRGEERGVSDEFMAFLRKEQRAKMARVFHNGSSNGGVRTQPHHLR
jgi:glycosyltransferase involved in cell wall biosynthesis